MRIFSHCASRGNGCTVVAVFEVKKEIPEYCFALQSHQPSGGRTQFHLQGDHSSMPASLRKNLFTLSCCLQGSSARSAAGRKPSRALAVMMSGVLLAALPVSAQQRRIQLDDLGKVVTVSDPQVSLDSKSIVCVVSRLNLDEDRSDDQLVLVDVATGAQRVLTIDRKKASSPRWSPNGDRLAFPTVVPYTKDNKDDTAKREDSAQVFVMPMSGGDAKKITTDDSTSAILIRSGPKLT